MTLKRFMAMNIFDLSELWFFSTRFRLYQFRAQQTPLGQRALIVSINGPELRRFCFDIDPHGALAERDAGHRTDRSNQRSAKTLFKRRLFAVVLRDGENPCLP
jgi:hypothetical protein